MSKVFAVHNGSMHHIHFFDNKDAVKGFIKKFYEEQVELVNRRYFHQNRYNKMTPTEQRKVAINQILKSVFVLEFEMEALFNLTCPSFYYLQPERNTEGFPRKRKNMPYFNSGDHHKLAPLFMKELERFEDITSEFIEVEVGKIPTHVVIQATVTKKGLASTGQQVTIIDDRIEKPEDVEKFMGGLNKISVNIPNWGKVSMSPKSLGDVKSTQMYNKTSITTLIE